MATGSPERVERGLDGQLEKQRSFLFLWKIRRGAKFLVSKLKI